MTRPGYGIGLGSAETMELAIREVGAPRILFAAAITAELAKGAGVGEAARTAKAMVREGIAGRLTTRAPFASVVPVAPSVA